MPPEERESQRLATACELIQDTSDSSVDLDAIARVAARLFDVPVALVTLIDASTVWIRGSHGVSGDREDRQDAFCSDTVELAPGEVFLVPDALQDDRFADAPLVAHAPHIRFYAGVPLAVDGQSVGTLCIMDRVPRPDIGPERIQELRNLAIVAETQLGLYRSRVGYDTELRERGRVEALLKEREAEFRSISEVQKIAETVGSFGLWHVDLDAWTILWSEGVARIFDRPVPPRCKLDFDAYLTFFHPDDRQDVRNRILRAKAGDIAEGGRYRGQARVFRPDGELRDIVVEGIAERDADGRVIALHGVLLDITDLTRSEKQARATSDLLRTTLETMDQGLVLIDPDQKVRLHNKRARDLLCLPETMLFDGASFLTVRRHQIAHGEFDRVSDAFSAFVLQGDLEGEPITHERIRPNGTVLEVRTVPLEDGSVLRTYTDVTERRTIESAVLDSAQRFRLLAETTTDVIIWSNLDTTRRYVSPASKAVLGFEPEELVGTKPLDFTHPDDVGDLIPLLDDLSHARVEHVTSRHRYRRKDGAWIWVEVSFSLTRDTNGVVTGYVASIRDISDRKAAEDALRFSQEQLALALDSGSDGVFDFDMLTGEVRLSGPWLAMVGYADGDIDPTIAGWGELTHPDDFSRCNASLIQHLKGESPKFECEYRVRTKSCDYVWTLTRGKVVSRDLQGRALRMVGTLIDITHRKEAEQLIAHMAHHDALTGLPNRTLFRQRLNHKLADNGQTDNDFAILACDLDSFKAVNDTLGHSAGDQLLRIVAERLKSVARLNDTVARLGGDEFAIILGSLERRESAALVAQRMIQAVELPIQIEGHSICVGMSIGIAFGKNDGQSAEHLFRNADIALYQAKAEGRNTYRFFRAGMDALVVERNLMANDMREAVRRNEFELRYQSIVNIGSRTIVGFEALLRWNDPKRGEVQPSEFIPIAEQTGLIVPLGEWALLEACRTAASWPHRLRVAVNVSTVQFHRPDELKRSVLNALASSGLEADRLELEITESVMMHDVEAVIACLHSLRELGIRIALDDFGTGFSSLNYLRRFPFSKIKIDQSFVREISDPDTVAIVRAVVGLGTRVGADITAEGVETRDQLVRVKSAGCTEVQGYLFNKPLSAEDAAALVKARAPQVAA